MIPLSEHQVTLEDLALQTNFVSQLREELAQLTHNGTSNAEDVERLESDLTVAKDEL